MYSEQDKIEISKRLKKYVTIMIVGLLVCLAVSVVGMLHSVRSLPLTMLGGVGLFVFACFMWMMFVYPNIKYGGYLKDMDQGLTKNMDCTVLEIDEKEELQDGVRVYPVHVFLEDEQDERILYIDVSKMDQMPKKGEKAHFGCFGRHIKEAQAF